MYFAMISNLFFDGLFKLSLAITTNGVDETLLLFGNSMWIADPFRSMAMESDGRRLASGQMNST